MVADYLLFLLFTGLRRQEAATLKWSNIDLDDRSFTLTDTKNREPLTLPLTDFVFDLLQSRKAATDSEYVFAGDGKAGYLIEPPPSSAESYSIIRSIVHTARSAPHFYHDCRKYRYIRLYT